MTEGRFSRGVQVVIGLVTRLQDQRILAPGFLGKVGRALAREGQIERGAMEGGSEDWRNEGGRIGRREGKERNPCQEKTNVTSIVLFFGLLEYVRVFLDAGLRTWLIDRFVIAFCPISW